MLKANGIAVLPADRLQIEVGEEVNVHLLSPVGELINKISL
jgi:molybdopterin biosynthesis enzyme